LVIRRSVVAKIGTQKSLGILLRGVVYLTEGFRGFNKKQIWIGQRAVFTSDVSVFLQVPALDILKVLMEFWVFSIPRKILDFPGRQKIVLWFWDMPIITPIPIGADIALAIGHSILIFPVLNNILKFSLVVEPLSMVLPMTFLVPGPISGPVQVAMGIFAIFVSATVLIAQMAIPMNFPLEAWGIQPLPVIHELFNVWPFGTIIVITLAPAVFTFF
jgi:hypothetical protein